MSSLTKGGTTWCHKILCSFPISQQPLVHPSTAQTQRPSFLILPPSFSLPPSLPLSLPTYCSPPKPCALIHAPLLIPVHPGRLPPSLPHDRSPPKPSAPPYTQGFSSMGWMRKESRHRPTLPPQHGWVLSDRYTLKHWTCTVRRKRLHRMICGRSSLGIGASKMTCADKSLHGSFPPTCMAPSGCQLSCAFCCC